MEDKKYSKLKSVFEATQSQVPDDFTKRVMKRIEEQTSVPHPKRHRMWFYPTIAAAASVLLLISFGIVSNNQNDEGNNLVVQRASSSSLWPLVRRTPTTSSPSLMLMAITPAARTFL